jgi:2-polyprenyl-3-methyl-5-hydroxy-6-metoxy-1,4-benzoquinol methylase
MTTISGLNTCNVPGTTQAALDLLAVPPPAHLLDLGCYHVDVSLLLANRGFRVASFDICDYPGTERLSDFRKGDAAEGIPWPDCSFDAIVCTEVIEHVENPFRLIREVSRLLQVGGVAVISTPNVDSLFARLHLLLRGYFPTYAPDQIRDWGHISPISAVWLNEMVRRSGLTIEMMTTEMSNQSWKRRVVGRVARVAQALMPTQPGLSLSGQSLLFRLRKHA